MKSLEREILCDAVLHFGVRTQTWKAVEELGELIAALGKLEVKPTIQAQDAVIDEIADVSIMLGQLSLIFGESAVQARRTAKINRLAGMIGLSTHNLLKEAPDAETN